MNETSKLTGVALAAAAATLFIAGCASSGGGTQMADASTVKVKCYGANACKGQAECKTALNGCKGQNACKAQGFVMLTAPLSLAAVPPGDSVVRARITIDGAPAGTALATLRKSGR